jgi:hypothetical protein
MNSYLFFIAASLLLGQTSCQYLVSPPTTAPLGTILDCTYWDIVNSRDTCTSLASSYGLSIELLMTYVCIDFVVYRLRS